MKLGSIPVSDLEWVTGVSAPKRSLKMLFSLWTEIWKRLGNTDRQRNNWLHFSLWVWLGCVSDPLVSSPLLVMSCVSAAHHKGSKGRHHQEGVLQRRLSGQETRSFSRVWVRGIWRKGSRIHSHQRNGQWSSILSTVSLHQKEQVPSCFSRGLINSSFPKWFYDCVKALSYLRIIQLDHK